MRRGTTKGCEPGQHKSLLERLRIGTQQRAPDKRPSSLCFLSCAANTGKDRVTVQAVEISCGHFEISALSTMPVCNSAPYTDQVCRIVVTQPRRIAAISVAERVAWERGQQVTGSAKASQRQVRTSKNKVSSTPQVGQSIGYAVHGNAVRPSARGSIEFLTVGTLLRRAVDDSCLRNCDVVIVDEVHERDMLTDFLLVLLREA